MRASSCRSTRRVGLGTPILLRLPDHPPAPIRLRPGPAPHQERAMILRVDKLLTALPVPSNPSPAAAAAVQEVMGGKTGELSTLMNYLFQSNNFRGREAYRPYYDLIANIAAEEWGHVELVSHTINLLLTGATTRGSDPSKAPLADAANERYSYHFLQSGQAAVPADSMGNWWNGSYVTNTGNLKLD